MFSSQPPISLYKQSSCRPAEEIAVTERLILVLETVIRERLHMAQEKADPDSHKAMQSRFIVSLYLLHLRLAPKLSFQP